MKEEMSFAFRRTVPVLFGYLFLGTAFGLMLQSAGYNFIWAIFISMFVYTGSGQFALVGLLSGGAGLFTTAVMQLSINSRHMFYGLSFIEKFKRMGKLYPYMIFSLTDETYSLLCSTAVPGNADEKKVFFLIALFDQIYWIAGSALGALIGQLIPFNSSGVEFAMTALFIVIFVEQWIAAKNHMPAIVGAVCGIICFLIFDPSNFILPALVTTVAVLTMYRQLSFKRKGAAK
ncbi:MAG: branched-chain amino acid ABC transporter permease [Clostridiales bacterium]|nr:branched-chain amino acid ABC transporter permease [Clostridiales bacterium]